MPVHDADGPMPAPGCCRIALSELAMRSRAETHRDPSVPWWHRATSSQRRVAGNNGTDELATASAGHRRQRRNGGISLLGESATRERDRPPWPGRSVSRVVGRWSRGDGLHPAGLGEWAQASFSIERI